MKAPLSSITSIILAMVPMHLTAQEIETPPILQASEILKPEIVKGAHHSVQESVPTTGFLNQYTLESNYGVSVVKGNALLAKRIHEINAMVALDQIQKSDEFKKALANTAKMPLKMVENLIDDPQKTAQQIGAGAKRFVKRAGELFERNGQKTKEEDNALQSALGFSSAKRKICWDLKVDPYTSNQALQKKLDDLAWTSFAGSFTVKLGMLAIPGGAGTAISGVSTSSTIAESIRDNSPVDLSAQNRKILTAMGVNPGLIQAFIDAPELSPSVQTIIVRKLSEINQAQGRDVFIQMCLSSRSAADAVFFQRIAQLMQHYHQNNSPIQTIFNLHGLPAAYTQDQTLIIPLELDYGSWSQDAIKLTAAIAAYQLPGKEIKQRQLVISGKLSDKAVAGLDQAEIKFIENFEGEGVYLP